MDITFERLNRKYKDFCPLCGSRFYGDTPENVYNQIAEHLKADKDGKSYCEKHWRSFNIALQDTGEE